MGYWAVVQHAIKNADVVLLVADARIPQHAANAEIVRKASLLHKEVWLVFNKTDLIARSALAALQKKVVDAHFVSAQKGVGVTELQKALEGRAALHDRASLRVAILGYPNAGKSTLLNLLAPGAHAKTSRISGTTKQTQWIRVGAIRYMDTPGVIPQKDKAALATLLSAKDPHKLKHPEKAACALVEYLLRSSPGVLEKTYGISESDSYQTFLAIGSAKSYLQKGGEVDEHRTGVRILEDWQRAKISLR